LSRSRSSRTSRNERSRSSLRAGSADDPRTHSPLDHWRGTGENHRAPGRKRSPIPDRTLAIRRTWQDGETIAISLPMELRQEPLPAMTPSLLPPTGRSYLPPIWRSTKRRILPNHSQRGHGAKELPARGSHCNGCYGYRRKNRPVDRHRLERSPAFHRIRGERKAPTDAYV